MTTIEIKEILSKYFTNLAATLPDADAYADLFCYRKTTDPATIYYIPLKLSPEKGQQEKLQFNLLVTGTVNMIQLASRWDTDRSLLKRLQESLLEKLKPESISSINFSTPSTTVKEARLELADDNKKYNVLQSTTTSGFPPFNVIFNISIDNAQKDRVLHTLNGTDNYMRTIYIATIPVNKTASAALKGDLTKIPELTKPELDHGNIPALLNKAIEDGVFELQIQGDDEMMLAEKLKQLIFDKAIEAIKNYAENNRNYTSASNDIVMKEGNLSVKASAQTTADISIEPEGDISKWFEGKNTTDYITRISEQDTISNKLSPGKTTAADDFFSKPGAEITVFAPPDLQESTINFITIISDNSKAILSPPDFVPVKISRPAGGNLKLNTTYTDGGPPFETTVAEKTGNDVRLNPSDIGLSEVVFDAESLETEKADSCRIHIVYLPRTSGTDDDRTIYMKPGEWKSRWYVCSRDATLKGELRYDVKVKNKDGSSSKYSGRSSEPVIHFKTS
ncbi:hypothetical protein [Flavitalea sp.]|nr:hypothetical protein [Flavitalea sp.]